RPTISISNSSPAFTPKASTASGGNETEAVSSRVVILFDITANTPEPILRCLVFKTASRGLVRLGRDMQSIPVLLVPFCSLNSLTRAHCARRKTQIPIPLLVTNPEDIMAGLSVRSQL